MSWIDQPLNQLMEELSIKVTIANRQYPLKIKREDEERVKKAADLLNERIKEYEQQYAVSDKLDLISMCAMQFASELVNLSEQVQQEKSDTSNAITELNKKLTDRLNNNNVH